MSSLRTNWIFLRLLAGRFVTNAGDSLYVIATMWIVYDLTESSLYPGLAGFLLGIPVAAQFLVGPLVDRWSIQRVLTGTQVLQSILILGIPLAAWSGHLSVWVVLFIVPFLAMINQFVYPAQNKALPHIVSDGQLVQANSLFALANNGTEMVFRAVGGLMIAATGVVFIYVFGSLTFAVAAVLFVGVTVEVPKSGNSLDESNPVSEYFDELSMGIMYVRGSVVRDIVFGKMASNFAFAMLIAVLPELAASFSGSRSYGFLLAAIAGGGLFGSLVASFFETYSLGALVGPSYLVAAIIAAGAVVAEGFIYSLVLFGAAFVPMGLVNVLLIATLQSSVSDSMLARITSLQASAIGIAMPVGSLVGGAIASFVGIEFSLWIIVGIVGAVSAYFLFVPRLRSLPSVTDIDERTLGLR